MSQPELPKGYHRPRRQGSWPKKEAVVFVKSTDSLYLDDLEDIQNVIGKEQEALKVVDLPRFKGKKDIYVPRDKKKHNEHTGGNSKKACPCCQYVATVRFDRMDGNMRLKRAWGSVRKLYVFEYPL